MSDKRIDEIKTLLMKDSKVFVNDLSKRFGVSKVSARKYLAKLEREGFAIRFYGGASLIEKDNPDDPNSHLYKDLLLNRLAEEARKQINHGDSIYIGSGRTCCVLAKKLEGLEKLSVVTNNITALPVLIKNAARVYLIGGEVTSTDNQTLFSSWESPEALLKNIYVNKAFTSASGLDMKAGLTVDSIISTYIFRNLPSMTHKWFMMADHSKFGKISIYPIADLNQIHTLITDRLPDSYGETFKSMGIEVIETNKGE